METRRKKVIQFIKKEYKKTGKNPSIREICKGLGLTHKVLYELFPGGTAEMCAAAGVPEDKANRVEVEKASQALKEKRIKTASDGKLNSLTKKKNEINAEVKQAQTTEKMNREIVEGELQLAGSLEGRRRIFSDPQRMLQFAERTTAYDSHMVDDSNAWDLFVAYCKTWGFDLAKKLFQVVGPLEDFESATDEKELHEYIRLRLEFFLIDRKEEQRHKMMQTKFEDTLQNSICSSCGKRATAALIENNEPRCPCGNTKWQLWCPSCRQLLQFETEKDAFYCQHCKISFRLPGQKHASNLLGRE